MAATSIFPPVSKMAELRSHGIGVPFLFPIDMEGIVVVSGLHLSIRFSLKASTIWVESEMFHLDTELLVQTLHETYKLTDNGNVVWELGAGKIGFMAFQILRWECQHKSLLLFDRHCCLKHPAGNNCQNGAWCRQRYKLV
jgi:hypothetical protein